MSIVVGDVVRKKSGGPRMDVDSKTDMGLCCSWIDKDKKLQTGVFPPETLEKYVAPDMPSSYLPEGRRRSR
jgi:uncharacterized protein YodC (DUF2158 family)